MSCLCAEGISPGSSGTEEESSAQVDQELLDFGSLMYLVYLFIYHFYKKILQDIKKKY